MLAAEQAHGVSAGAQECDAGLLTNVHKLGTFTEEAIAWVHCIAPASQITFCAMAADMLAVACMLPNIMKWISM